MWVLLPLTPVILPVILGKQLTPDVACQGEFTDSEATQLLQTRIRALRPETAQQPNPELPLPLLRPWGHSYYSSDPAATAQFLTRYFKKSRLLHYSGNAAPCGGQKAVVEYCPKPQEPCMVQILVNDPLRKNASDWDLNPDHLVDVSTAEFSRVANETMRGLANFSAWMDFHDGWRSEDFDLNQLLADGTEYHAYTEQMPTHLVRIDLPRTMWTMDLHYTVTDVSLVSCIVPDMCRNWLLDWTYLRETEMSSKGNGWWKTTYASPNPTAAADFVIQALGAERMMTPFPPGKIPGCIFAEWVVFRDGVQGNWPTAPSGFEMHFVQQSEVWPSGEVTVEQFAAQQESKRDLEAGVFDAFMYNSLILRADSLDPFVLRLQTMGAPFLPVSVDGEFAVFVDIPKNGIVLQLRSETLTVVAPRAVTACV